MPQTVPPETVALVRRRYAAGDLISAIQADIGFLSIGVFYNCLDGRYDDGSGAPLPLPKIPRRLGGLRIMRSPSRRKSVVARIWRNAEAQVERIEKRLAESGMATEDFERDTRSLAVVVRTLRELEALDAKRNKGKQQKPTNDEPVPRDIRELRRELVRKMEALLQDEPRAGQGNSSALGGESI
jgi:hypothetical protein